MIIRFCDFCNKEFELKSHVEFGAHRVNCSLNPKRLAIIEKLRKTATLKRIQVKKKCQKCDNEFLIERTIDKNGNQKVPKKEKQCCSRKCSNLISLSSVIQKRIKNGYKRKRSFNKKLYECKSCSKEIAKNKHERCRSCYYLTDSHSEKLKGKTGGIRKGGGCGKSGWYKGYWCDSSWELAYVIYNLEHGIKFERNKDSFEYVFQNEKFKYYPDFIENGEYVEIKGYADNKCKEKIAQFNLPLRLIDEEKMQKYISYVREKYGEDFVSLYNKRNKV